MNENQKQIVILNLFQNLCDRITNCVKILNQVHDDHVDCF